MIENSIVAGAQDDYDALCAESTPEEIAVQEIRKLEFQRQLLNNVDASPGGYDWDALAVSVFEDDDFIPALFQVLHSHPELQLTTLIRRHAERLADQWHDDQ